MSLEDIFRAELIVLAGQNPGTNHPRMLSALETAKRRGAKIISINPAEDADPSAVLLAVAGEIENIGLTPDLAELRGRYASSSTRVRRILRHRAAERRQVE